MTVNKRQSGFTLVEVITGIVVLGIALAVVGSVLLPTEQQSADQIMQIRASELAQSLTNEIQTKSFDEHSDRVGGIIRCDSASPALACTNESAFGADTGESRVTFDDVDDYHGALAIVGAANNPIVATEYSGFSVNVDVSYGGSDLGFTNNRLAKKIEISVTTPLGEVIQFTSYKTNF